VARRALTRLRSSVSFTDVSFDARDRVDNNVAR
jgi:hypothetical protein